MTTAEMDSETRTGPNVVAWKAADIEESVANAAKNAVVAKMAKCERGYIVRTVRFLPTTKSYLPNPSRFEILANISVDTGEVHPKFGFAPSRVLQAVIAIGETEKGQTFEKVTVLH
jgi:hypothetical protein